MTGGRFEPMRLDVEDGTQVVVTARNEGTEPERLAAVVQAAWKEVAGLTAMPAAPVHAVTRIVRERAAAFIEFSPEYDPQGTAGGIERAFRIQVEFWCSRCRSNRVLRPGSWRDLRDALAPAGLPGWLGPSRVRKAAPLDADLVRRIELALDHRREFSWAGHELERHLRQLERFLCPVCVPSERARLREFVETFRPRFEAASRRKATERKALDQGETENLLYVIVTAPPSEIGRQVSAWIMRGYEVWGAPLVCGEQLSQALVRADVVSERRLTTGSSECSSRPSPPCAPSGAATGPRGIAPESPMADILDLPITGLELSTRSLNCLRAYDIHNLKDLVQCTESQLLEMQNLGKKSLADIITALGRLGLRAGTRRADPAMLLEVSDEGQGIPDVSIPA
ncbi:MAG: hypothetical protein M0038_06595 [Pseudomonadota bacterium]|nr:hypothetical protein [Pseudomonadota bacterium]